MNQVLSYDEMLKSGGYPGTADQRVEDLIKALSTTNSGPGGIQSGPLMLQNLDPVMTEVLQTEKHLKLYNLLTKVPSAQPYYEYNVHKGFGAGRGAIGFRQGGAPTGGISTFKREGIYNKFLGRQGGVTHQMLITGQNGGAFEDPNVRENRDRTLELLVRLDRELVHGSKSILDENGEEVHFDGLLAAMLSVLPANVIDKQGAALTYDDLDDTSEDLVTNGKQASVDGYNCIMSPHVSKGLNLQYQSRNIIRENKGDGKRAADFVPGFKVPAYDGQFGTIEFDHSILLQEVDGAAPNAAAAAGAPASPAITTQPTAGTDATVHIPANTYYYSVAAFNDTDESLPTITNAVAVIDGKDVTIVVTRVSNATGYRIYRGLLADGSDHRWIAKVAQPASGNLTFVDDGSWRTVDANGKPSDGLAIIVKPDPKDICIAQMTPLVKMPLPQVGTTYPFLLLLYIVLVAKAPQRIRIYKNCGQYTPA